MLRVEARFALADRFFCLEPPAEGRIALRGEEVRHLARVRRLGVGDEVEVFDGRSTMSHRARVEAVSGDRVELLVLGEPVIGREPIRSLTLGVAVPKGERFDWLVEKAVEVGVTRLVPLLTKRSVVNPRPGKLEKQRRAIIESSKQCGRNRLMELASPTPLARFLEEESDSIRLLGHPDGPMIPKWPVPNAGQAVTLAIGPEGGFTPEEVQVALSTGWRTVALGPTILRIETAAIVGAALALSLPEGAAPSIAG